MNLFERIFSKRKRVITRKVESSALKTVAYDPNDRTLSVEFTSGKVYRYHNVPPTVFRSLVDAESVGTYFSKNVRNEFEYERVS